MPPSFQQTTTRAVWVCVTAVLVGFYLPWIRIDLRGPGKPAPHKPPVWARQRQPEQRPASELDRMLNEAFRGLSHGSRELVGKIREARQLNGAQIPRFVNSETSKTAMALAEHFSRKRERLGLKSYLVYLLPVIALLLGFLAMRWTGRVVAALIAVVAFGVAGEGSWQLLIVNAKPSIIWIWIGPGLWLSMTGYASLGLTAIARVIPAQAEALLLRLIPATPQTSPADVTPSGSAPAE